MKHALKPRWAAPPDAGAHPTLALVTYGERLFSYAELIGELPPELAGLEPDLRARAPQQWWNRCASRFPIIAGLAAARCRSLDFDVLDLYAAEAAGHG